MARIKLDLDSETYQHLLDAALAERRPVHWQAEIMLRQALGLSFPYELENGLDNGLDKGSEVDPDSSPAKDKTHREARNG